MVKDGTSGTVAASALVGGIKAMDWSSTPAAVSTRTVPAGLACAELVVVALTINSTALPCTSTKALSPLGNKSDWAKLTLAMRAAETGTGAVVTGAAVGVGVGVATTGVAAADAAATGAGRATAATVLSLAPPPQADSTAARTAETKLLGTKRLAQKVVNIMILFLKLATNRNITVTISQISWALRIVLETKCKRAAVSAAARLRPHYLPLCGQHSHCNTVPTLPISQCITLALLLLTIRATSA